MSESLKTVLNEWRPINGEDGEVAYEDQIKALEAENTRLLDIVQREPAACYLEAVQRACDERLTHLKHAEREARARAEKAERQLARAREALEWYARCDIAAKSVADGSTCRMEHDDGARARAALQDIAATSGKE
jgi:transcription elongation GreA/GreB family factor